MISLSLDLFRPSDCLCGWPAPVDEYEDHVRIGGWCFCAADKAPIAVGKTMAEAREEWEMLIMAGAL